MSKRISGQKKPSQIQIKRHKRMRILIPSVEKIKETATVSELLKKVALARKKS